MRRYLGFIRTDTGLREYFLAQVVNIRVQPNHMPQKRALPSSNDDYSPPPAQRQKLAVEHHLSPIAGRHPETPADAAVAISTPPRRQDETIDNQELHGIASENICPNVAGQNDITLHAHPAGSPAQQETPATEPGRSTATNGGARAAYAASQQQRIITCNLTTIPAST
jgi:hypothetical protein